MTDLCSRHVIWKVFTQPHLLIKSSLASEKLREEMIAAAPNRLRRPVAAVYPLRNFHFTHKREAMMPGGYQHG